MHTPPDLPTSNHNAIWDALFSMYFFPTLLVADEIGLFTLLDQSPRTIGDVAQTCGLSRRSAETLLGVLASKGFLIQHRGCSISRSAPESSCFRRARTIKAGFWRSCASCRSTIGELGRGAEAARTHEVRTTQCVCRE
jgi:hypothetical protein